eukprot:6027898-Pleurochrysis_carterae.AAC.5
MLRNHDFIFACGEPSAFGGRLGLTSPIRAIARAASAVGWSVVSEREALNRCPPDVFRTAFESARMPPLLSLTGLKCAQGLVGWWMVKSGLEEPPKNSDGARALDASAACDLRHARPRHARAAASRCADDPCSARAAFRSTTDSETRCPAVATPRKRLLRMAFVTWFLRSLPPRTPFLPPLISPPLASRCALFASICADFLSFPRAVVLTARASRSGDARPAYSECRCWPNSPRVPRALRRAPRLAVPPRRAPDHRLRHLLAPSLHGARRAPAARARRPRTARRIQGAPRSVCSLRTGRSTRSNREEGRERESQRETKT